MTSEDRLQVHGRVFACGGVRAVPGVKGHIQYCIEGLYRHAVRKLMEVGSARQRFCSQRQALEPESEKRRAKGLARSPFGEVLLARLPKVPT